MGKQRLNNPQQSKVERLLCEKKVWGLGFN